MLYFDTSYLVRLYLQDSGFEAVRTLAQAHPIASSRHGKTELSAALHRAYREERFSREECDELLSQVEEDYRCEGISRLALSDAVFDHAEYHFPKIPQETFLRSGDALHLACACLHGFKEIYSHDKHLLLAAPLFGLNPVNVIA